VANPSTNTCLAYWTLSEAPTRRAARALAEHTATGGCELLMLAQGLDEDEFSGAIPADRLTPGGIPPAPFGPQDRATPLLRELAESLQADTLREAIRCDELFCRRAGQEITRELLERHYTAWLAAWQNMLGLARPRAVLVWNGHQLPRSTLVERAGRWGIPVHYVERGPFADTLQVDTQGVNGRSSLARRPASDYDTPLGAAQQTELRQFLDHLQRTGASAWAQPAKTNETELRERLRIPSKAKLLFYPGQLDHDTNLLLNSPLFEGNSDILQWLDAELASLPDWHVLVKPHPKAIEPLGANALASDTVHVVTDVHVHSLLSAADAVVSINSSVIFEAMAAGKPVLALGKGLFSNKDVVLEATDRGDAARKLRTLLEHPNISPEQAERRERVLHRLVFQDLYRIDAESVEEEMRRLADKILAIAPPRLPDDFTRLSIEAATLPARRSQWSQTPQEALSQADGRDLLQALTGKVTERLRIGKTR